MSLSYTILGQTLTMALYMAVGFGLFRAKKISLTGSKDIASMLLWIVIPAVIIDSFCTPYSAERLRELAVSSLLGCAALIIAIVAARFVFPKAPIDHFAAAFSNAGFIGIPLVRQSLGNEAVFYLVGMITLLNILQWTYGSNVLKGGRVRITAKSILFNPIFFGAAVGLLMYFTGWGVSMPTVISGAIQGIAALNAPLAMIVMGIYLARSDIKSLVATPRLYWVAAMRLILIPLLTLLVFSFLPLKTEIRLAVLLAAAAPVGANAAVYSQLYELDYAYACQTVTLSTILSIITLPLITMLAQTFL